MNSLWSMAASFVFISTGLQKTAQGIEVMGKSRGGLTTKHQEKTAYTQGRLIEVSTKIATW
ncbi:hypothetical protein GCM10007082_29600 [Oceanisphaera arctica]|nr:hypothetical protein GCM10007082_29600 [Oceanisphaera arctica]